MTDVILAVVWTITCLIGGAYSAYNLVDARRDRAALAALRLNGILEITAGGNVRRERTRLMFWVIATAVGVVALAFPHTESPFVGVALIGVMALNAYNSQRDGAERRAIRLLPDTKRG